MGDSGDRRKRVLAKAAILIVVGLLLSGCSPVPADPRAVLEEKAATIDSTAQDLLEALHDAGLNDARARGIVDACEGMPDPGVLYRAGIEVKVGDDLAAAYAVLVDQLSATSWDDTDVYDDVEIDPATPAGQFTRDDVRLDVKTGGAKIGGKQYGSDEMQLGLTISQSCVRIPVGVYTSDFQDLEKKILPRERLRRSAEGRPREGCERGTPRAAAHRMRSHARQRARRAREARSRCR